MKATILAAVCLLGLVVLAAYDIKHRAPPHAAHVVELPPMAVHGDAGLHFTSATSVIYCGDVLTVSVTKSDGSTRIIQAPTTEQLKMLESAITDENQQFRVVLPCETSTL